jgi:hypothetical protein
MGKDIVLLHGANEGSGASTNSRRCSKGLAGLAMHPT